MGIAAGEHVREPPAAEAAGHGVGIVDDASLRKAMARGIAQHVVDAAIEMRRQLQVVPGLILQNDAATIEIQGIAMGTEGFDLHHRPARTTVWRAGHIAEDAAAPREKSVPRGGIRLGLAPGPREAERKMRSGLGRT